MAHSEQHEWITQAEKRQKNILLPDLIENENRFWRGIFKFDPQRPTVQKIGIAVLLISLTLGVLGTLMSVGWDPLSKRVRFDNLVEFGLGLFCAIALTKAFLMLLVWHSRERK